MEETGIIRRLDALGRIVIPREFRKLNRIEVGDPLEMRAHDSGEIVIRKVDIASQLKSVGSMAIDALSEKTDKLIGVCSTDRWLEFSSKCKFSGEDLPEKIASAVTKQKSTVIKSGEDAEQAVTKYVAIYPVYGDTGSFGAFALFSDSEPSSDEKNLFETMALFTGKSLQKF